MRNIILITLFLLAFSGYSQKYDFNFLTNYISTYKGKSRDQITYTNSNDSSYYLRIQNWDDGVEGQLWDITRSVVHYFDVEITTGTDYPMYTFKYRESERRRGTTMYDRYPISFTTLESGGTQKKLRMEVFKSNKKRTPFHDYEIMTESYEYDLFHAFRFSEIHPMEHVHTLHPGENCVVLEASTISSEGLPIKIKLDTLRHLKLTLEIP